MKQAIQKAMIEIANPKKGKEISSYMKNVLPFRGLQQPEITKVFNSFKDQIKQLEDDQKYEIADFLMRQEYGEDKKIALMIAEKMKFNLQRIKLTEKWFIDGHIKEWATADTYCGRVLKQFVIEKENAKLMLDWAKHENLWMRRSSCVGFVTLARKKVCDMNLLFEICQENIVHQERFNQLGTGWLLREMSLVDLKGVIEFIEKNIKYFSSEGLRYAYEKMKQRDQNYLKNLLKNTNSKDNNQQDDDDNDEEEKGDQQQKKQKLKKNDSEEESDEEFKIKKPKRQSRQYKRKL
ncbi:unnamed protein product (macronuclear) [Paramecium tetraurelia]|uniref:DNA alkylation repair enzyme n=1 Tax=Paramecium tetraurelia TaxID=5888 RepID=A0BG36_PARTE|nr:uncharacterized protein GSPATT00028538001 [Paramecium tetraurelia]CAK57503.1 unnamed protein product [Paramecium tetraurelia]|eukprot:XP_001424901.1 hypothetical protein (macronuclear) [Paramecium tetraurelia strain d4-2]